jgi:hypothetical protein
MARDALTFESTIDQVTVYAHGVRVRRSARVCVAGDRVVRFVGLPIVPLARPVDSHGFVTWTVELAPLGRTAVTLEYKVRSQRNVAGV